MDVLVQRILKVKPDLTSETLKKYFSNINTILDRVYKIEKKDYDKYYNKLDLWLYNRKKILDFLDTKSYQTKKTYISTLLTLLSLDNKDQEFIGILVEKQKGNKPIILLEHQKTLGEKGMDKIICASDFAIFIKGLKNNISRMQEYLLYKILWALPLRNEIGHLKYIKSTEFNKLTDKDKIKKNYLIVSNKEMKIYRDDYKTRKTYGPILTKINDKDLITTIREYVKKKNIKNGDFLFSPPKLHANGDYSKPLSKADVSNLLGNLSRAILDYPLSETNIFKSVIKHHLDIVYKDDIQKQKDFLLNKSKIRGTSFNELIHYYLLPKNKTSSLGSEESSDN